MQRMAIGERTGARWYPERAGEGWSRTACLFVLLRRPARLGYDQRVRRLGLVLALCAVGALSALAFAQDAERTRPVGSYAGVTPGSGNLPPRAPAQPGASQLMTWPGFQERPDGASRFFVQTTQPVTHEMRREQGRVVILLRNTQLHLRNNRRPLETRYFNTPVSRARIERRGHDLAFVLEMRADVTPSVSEQPAENGYHYLFVEFPSGDFLPAGLRTETIESVTEPVGGEPIGGEPIDDERPPGM